MTIALILYGVAGLAERFAARDDGCDHVDAALRAVLWPVIDVFACLRGLTKRVQDATRP